ncbi:MAG: ArsR/SmtB family transcription factor [Christensenellaceae bacterium]
MSEMLLLDRRTQSLIETSLPDEENVEKLVCFFNVFSDPTRLKILIALSITELCVTDLARVLKMNQTTISHQLRFLKGNGAVVTKRYGKVVFYSVSEKVVGDMLNYGVDFLGY